MRKFLLIIVLLAGLGAGGLLAASAGARQRAHLLVLAGTGQLPGIRPRELAYLLRPGAGFDLDALEGSRNPLAALRVPDHLKGDSGAARQLFEARCAACHGARGEGITGPSLAPANRRRGASDWATFRVLQDGVAGTAMQPTGLSFDDAMRMVAYLRRLGRREGETAGRAPVAPVSAAEIAGADTVTAGWLAYTGGWSGRRNRDIPGLTASTVKRLQLAWAYQLPHDPPTSQSVPIVAHGLLVVTGALDVIALDAEDGTPVWRFHRDLPVSVKLCCSRANRGAGVVGDLVVVGTLDAHLVALDLATGRLRWDVTVADAAAGYSITSAPFVAAGKLIVGVGGGEFGTRGFLDAYDPATGRRLWRHYTVPADGEPGRETWPAGATPGGGPTWVPGAYDDATKTLYWGVGNPSPDFAPELRPGTNLHTNSVIALDVETGRLRWAYQFTPNDSHDWDSAQTPILVDATWEGRPRALLLWPNRNAFLYVLDRTTGEFLRATPYARQTWNDGFDAQGRPRVRASSLPSPAGTIVYPGVGGAINWWPSSYSDRLGLVFAAIREDGSLFFRDTQLTGESGQYLGGRTQPIPGEGHPMAMIAVDVATGQVRWRTPATEQRITAMGGTTAVGDRLVLGGQSTTLVALDAKTGERLWQAGLGGPVQGAPVVWQGKGGARVAVTAGTVLYVLGAPAP